MVRVPITRSSSASEQNGREGRTLPRRDHLLPNSQTVAGSQRPATGRAPIEATASAAATSSGSTGTQRPERNAASRPPAAGGAPALGEHGQPARLCLPWSASVDDHASARGSSRWGCGGRKWLRGMSDRRATDPGVSGQDEI